MWRAFQNKSEDVETKSRHSRKMYSISVANPYLVTGPAHIYVPLRSPPRSLLALPSMRMVVHMSMLQSTYHCSCHLHFQPMSKLHQDWHESAIWKCTCIKWRPMTPCPISAKDAATSWGYGGIKKYMYQAQETNQIHECLTFIPIFTQKSNVQQRNIEELMQPWSILILKGCGKRTWRSCEKKIFKGWERNLKMKRVKKHLMVVLKTHESGEQHKANKVQSTMMRCLTMTCVLSGLKHEHRWWGGRRSISSFKKRCDGH